MVPHTAHVTSQMTLPLPSRVHKYTQTIPLLSISTIKLFLRWHPIDLLPQGIPVDILKVCRIYACSLSVSSSSFINCIILTILCKQYKSNASHYIGYTSSLSFSLPWGPNILFPHSVVTRAQPKPFSQTEIPIFIPSQQKKHVRLQYFIITTHEINCTTELLTILQDIYYPQFVNDTRLVWGHWSSRGGGRVLACLVLSLPRSSLNQAE